MKKAISRRYNYAGINIVYRETTTPVGGTQKWTSTSLHYYYGTAALRHIPANHDRHTRGDSTILHSQSLNTFANEKLKRERKQKTKDELSPAARLAGNVPTEKAAVRMIMMCFELPLIEAGQPVTACMT